MRTDKQAQVFSRLAEGSLAVAVNGQVFSRACRGRRDKRLSENWVELTGSQLNRGYQIVQLRPFGKFLVHQLVILAHKGCLLPGYEINHIDGNKLNNALENLEIVSRAENMNHAHLTGLSYRKRVPVICIETGAVFPSISAAAFSLGLDHRGICDVLKGRQKHTRGLSFKRLHQSSDITNKKQGANK